MADPLVCSQFLEVFRASKAYMINVCVEGLHVHPSPRILPPLSRDDQASEDSKNGEDTSPPFTKDELDALGS